jgi:nucleoside-diphosphate-sugar epimerase
MNIRNVLVTGAAGYLGRFVVERLRPAYTLRLFDRTTPSFPTDDREVHRGDVTLYDDVVRACEGQDAVVHLIALVRERFDKPPSLFADVMVKGTWNVAEACVRNGVPLLVNISSIVACGWPADTSSAYRVGSPSRFRAADLHYCLAKRLGEEIGAAYHEAHGLRIIHLRPGVIAGDGLNREPERPAGAPAFWFTHVDPRDVAQAVERALCTDLRAGTYQIVAGRDDALFDWRPARDELGYAPAHNWPDIPDMAESRKGGEATR